MSETLDLPLIDAATGRVVVDFHCGECGYNLRSLCCDVCCTECNAPIAPGLRPLDLRSADRRWVAKLHRRTRLAFWSLVGVLLSLLGGLPAVFLLGVPEVILLTLFWVAVVGSIIGISGLAAPEPGQDRTARRVWPERLASWLPYLLTICAVLILLGQDYRTRTDPAAIIVTGAFVLLTVASVFACVVCARRIARRLCNARLEVLVNGVMIALGSTVVLAVIGLLVGLLLVVFRSSTGAFVFMGLPLLLAAGLAFAAYLLAVMSLFGLRRELGRVLRQGGWRTPGE